MSLPHLLSVKDLKKEDIDAIMHLTKHSNYPGRYDKLILATLFFEPSTRTKLSFQSAMYRLGGKVIDLPSDSSQKKGETDNDTIKTISEYADLLVIRHPQSYIMETLAKCSKVPVINAGDGSNEHPTQALIDLYTIKQYKNQKNKITIMFTGDLFFSRTVTSIVELLKKENNEFIFIFANKVNPCLIDECGIYINESEIESYLNEVDVLYMTRPQKERGEVKTDFVLTNEFLNMMKANAIIMHPLPRNKELPDYIDNDTRAKYFQQVKNGLYVRMAIIKYMIG